jgi:hypothetical protein
VNGAHKKLDIRQECVLLFTLTNSILWDTLKP